MLEVGCVERTRGHEHHHRVLPSARRQCLEEGSKAPEEGREAAHGNLTNLVRKHPRDDLAVLVGVTGAAGGLGPVGEGHPLARGRPDEIRPIEVKHHLAGHRQAAAGAQEAGVGIDKLGWDEPVDDESLRSQVQVPEHPI